MAPIHVSLLFHLVGFGVIVTSLLGGWILHVQYTRAAGWGSRLVLLKSLRSLGLLSPIGIIILAASGIMNMIIHGLGPFTHAWLTAKLVFFALAIVNGVVSAIRGKRRTTLVIRLADGETVEGSGETLSHMDRQFRFFFINQTVLILLILILTLIRP